MKSHFSTKRAFSWTVIIIVRQQSEAKSFAPPLPGKRTLGFW